MCVCVYLLVVCVCEEFLWHTKLDVLVLLLLFFFLKKSASIKHVNN